MQTRDGYLPGVPCWVDTGQPDPDAAVSFYGGLFGWEWDPRRADESSPVYNIALLDGHEVAAVGPLPEGYPRPPVWTTYVCVESADDTAAKVTEAGGNVLAGPFDVGDAGRMAACADQAGAGFSLWQPGRTKGAQVVNEPGSWNFSGLNARDVDGAIAFYGAVFGWEASEFGGDNLFWRLPGYADFLEQRDPGVRERNRAVGAPEGFEDSVAWVAPMTSEQFPDDTPPHWSVTFAVADADATASRAAELGASVLVPPMDAPWVRTTVIADPQGAVFTASKFVPPER